MTRALGKSIGGSVYLHRSAAGASEHAEAIARAGSLLPDGFAWHVAKVNTKTGAVTFTSSPDFDTADEPAVGDAIRVTAAGELEEQPAAADPWIYHHKWMMVAEDYAGFDVAESRARSEKWEALPDVDRSRIGKRSWWDEHVAVRLEARRARMPVKAAEVDGKWRVVNADTDEPETNEAGTPLDGGGHGSKAEADAQARAVNARQGVRAELVMALRLGLPGFLTNEDPEAADGLALAIKTGEPVGPFPTITAVPVGVLELMPVSELKRLENARHLFWIPLELEHASEAREEVAPITEDQARELRLLSGASTAKARPAPSAPMRFYQEAGLLVGDVLDFGCGHDPHDFARYDPAHAPDPTPLQRTWDTVTCNYVLNVLPLEGLRANVMLALRALVAADGQALVSVWSRGDDGETIVTSKGYQCGWTRAEWGAFLGKFWTVEELDAPGGVWSWRLQHQSSGSFSNPTET